MGPVAPLLAQKVHTGVGGQAVQPGGKAGFPPEETEPLPRGEEGLLGRLGGVLRIFAHPHGQCEHPLLIEPDQRFKGVLVPLAGGVDPLLFLHLTAGEVQMSHHD